MRACLFRGVTRRVLVDASYCRNLGLRKVGRGSWSRQAPGLYLTSTDPPTLDQRRLAALMRAGPGAVLCGAAAAVLHGARDVPARGGIDVLSGTTARWATNLREARAVVLAASCDRLCLVTDLQAALAVGGNPGGRQACREEAEQA